jgi:hypothetical protein
MNAGHEAPDCILCLEDSTTRGLSGLFVGGVFTAGLIRPDSCGTVQSVFGAAVVFTSTAGRISETLCASGGAPFRSGWSAEGVMATGLNDSHDRPAAISPPTWVRRDRLEQQFLAKVRAMAGFHLAAGDGVERAAYALVDELREEGLRCEHTLLALKALVRRTAAQPQMLISEIVPLCITYYYTPATAREG